MNNRRKQTFVLNVESSPNSSKYTSHVVAMSLLQGMPVTPYDIHVQEVVDSGSYRDPDLSPKWLNEAEWIAKNYRLFNGDKKSKIILRLVQEVVRLRKMLGRR